MGSQPVSPEVSIIDYKEAVEQAEMSQDDGMALTHWLACAAQDFARKLRISCHVSTTLRSIRSRGVRARLLTRGGHPLCLEVNRCKPLAMIASGGRMIGINEAGEAKVLDKYPMVPSVMRVIRIYLIAARKKQTEEAGSCS